MKTDSIDTLRADLALATNVISTMSAEITRRCRGGWFEQLLPKWR
jgi:hypothetical protein